ncbi:MAG: COR domain-containing protein [Methylococcales bacterium]|nr:COR domain-containing protein [Methylococcales bacterium]
MSDWNIIQQIEQTIGRSLQQTKIGSALECSGGYVLNKHGLLIALNLNNCGMRDISFLSQCMQLQILSLYGNKITNFGVLGELKKLNSLVLRGCKISDIEVLKELRNLKTLYLDNNELRDISALKELKALTVLDLSYNEIENFSVLDGLKNLTYLNLSENGISDIRILRKLQNLTVLVLAYNNIEDISVLKELKKLEAIFLDNNKITEFSSLKSLDNLRRLNLSHNQISNISTLEEFKALESLDLSNNQISDICVLKEIKHLQRIELQNNLITELPEWILDFGLEIKKYTFDGGICIDGNPLQTPPLEIIKQGNAAIRAYFEQLKKEGVDYIYEAKLILVGEGGAGKTSLANKIINPDYQLVSEKESIPTQGIDIFSYSFPYDNKNFRVNIWDFAGQELKHQTHQFFLTKRSLYFVLVDNRTDSPNLDYWFKLVELLSDASPVLIIKNEKKNCTCSSIQESQLKAEFNIKESLTTNLDDNRGLEKIVESLQHFITQLPHIGSPLPKTWVKVRQKLEELAETKNCIELKEYFAICQDNGFEKDTDKLQLSEYLHDLGVCLHFQHDENSPLYKTLILKPTWATDAVYKVLDNPQVISNAGHFSKEDLAAIWQDEQYKDMRGELLALMQKFKLCYEIPNQAQNYIAPQLLNENPPQYNWQSKDNLLLRYQYDFMPKGIVSQFIVIMHEYIANNYQWVWKHGVVLEKDKNQAEIVEIYGKREIHIRVYGQNKKDLQTIISHELDRINCSYERLKDKCKKLIPCNCEKCKDSQEPYFYDYEKLKERISHRKYTIECGNPPYADVDILKLTDDINLPVNENSQLLSHLSTTIFAETAIVQPVGETNVNNKKNNVHAEANAQVQQFKESSNNTANQNQTITPESKDESLFKKPLFYIGMTAFIYFMLVAWEAYDLQQKGLLGNKTFKEIVLAPIPLLNAENKT